MTVQELVFRLLKVQTGDSKIYAVNDYRQRRYPILGMVVDTSGEVYLELNMEDK